MYNVALNFPLHFTSMFQMIAVLATSIAPIVSRIVFRCLQALFLSFVWFCKILSKTCPKIDFIAMRSMLIISKICALFWIKLFLVWQKLYPIWAANTLYLICQLWNVYNFVSHLDKKKKKKCRENIIDSK